MAKPKVKWRLEDAESRLWEVGIEVSTIEKMPSGYGSIIRTHDGRIVCVYDTGSLTCQGKLMADTKLLFEDPPSSLPSAGSAPNASIGVPSEAVESFSLPAFTNPPEGPQSPSRPLGEAYSKSRVIVTAEGDPEDVMPWD
ncbi:hypothetical protein [Gluconobacter kondonii]|uniref:hypothetical protein n=1 Tax=Gluconobacter kondonii TaxID=941463 RepID=UPI001B8BB57E|nr:hypothetical protein [Gluconobacter kondonii]MBS1083515.1 hypothetical protein [Gluconobacter kondonii]